MTKFTSMAFAALLATGSTVALAGEETQSSAQAGPVALSDTQLDAISAGQIQTGDLVAINTGNIASNNNVAVQVPVSAAVNNVAVGILSRQTQLGTATSQTNTGRLLQGQ